MWVTRGCNVDGLLYTVCRNPINIKPSRTIIRDGSSIRFFFLEWPDFLSSVLKSHAPRIFCRKRFMSNESKIFLIIYPKDISLLR